MQFSHEMLVLFRLCAEWETHTSSAPSASPLRPAKFSYMSTLVQAGTDSLHHTVSCTNMDTSLRQSFGHVTWHQEAEQ
jgi:hypothetical protein